MISHSHATRPLTPHRHILRHCTHPPTSPCRSSTCKPSPSVSAQGRKTDANHCPSTHSPAHHSPFPSSPLHVPINMSPSAGRWRHPCSWDGCSASLKRRCLEAACHRHYRRSVESLLCSFLRCGVMCIFRGDLESETQGGGMTPLWWPLPLMSVRCAAACPPCGGVWGERRHLGRGKVKRFMACPS